MEAKRVYLSRGSKSRNKVSVGEPAEGSVICFLLTRSGVADSSEQASGCL